MSISPIARISSKMDARREEIGHGGHFYEEVVKKSSRFSPTVLGLVECVFIVNVKVHLSQNGRQSPVFGRRLQSQCSLILSAKR